MLVRTVAAALVALLIAGCGITGNFRHDPGYAPFGATGSLAVDREFGISLGPLPLAFARLVLDDDPEIEPILKDLRAVRVYSYTVTGDAEGTAQEVRTIQSRLLDDGWIALITVREHAEQTAVLLRPDSGGRNRGLAVIVQDPQEVVLVNLIGNVRLDLFADYMAELDVDTPGIEIDPQTLAAHVQ
jgi:Domain of unknown function (DUF4252)